MVNVQLEYLELTIRWREVGEVLVVTGRAPACWLVWRGMQYRRSQAFITELETSTRIQSKRMTNHNTPQLSGMDSANHSAAFPGLSALTTTTVPSINPNYSLTFLCYCRFIFWLWLQNRSLNVWERVVNPEELPSHALCRIGTKRVIKQQRKVRRLQKHLSYIVN
jgi:hypothetical protein